MSARLGSALFCCAVAVTGTRAGSNIAPGQSRVDSAFIGDLDWRSSAEHGVSINRYYCSGYIHGKYIGWIQMGAGAPANKFQYQNDSAADFGVNLTAAGELRGYAYGANIGWILFGPAGNPRVDWATGTLHGSIYSANVGWIPLENTGATLRLESAADPIDSDEDGLPDPWEILHAGNLRSLSGGLDSDGDGQSDRDEYLAGTNPLNAKDFLGPLAIELEVTTDQKTLRWPSKENFIYAIEQRDSLEPSGAAWTSVTAEPILGTGQALSIPISNPSPGMRFFRLRAAPPLSPFEPAP